MSCSVDINAIAICQVELFLILDLPLLMWQILTVLHEADACAPDLCLIASATGP